ncbi:MAG TPA: hypothetical protein VFM06_03450 [Candidatus Limnocylindria bacterium]|nr:hypothetical protein [Candidatus Limnocylindria bacterium]
MERQPPVDTATLRGARAVAIVCAVAFLAPIPLSVAFPAAFFYAPYHSVYEKMIVSLLGSFGLGLLLVLRDPARNAGVFAVVGLATGSLAGANIYALIVDDADPLHWWLQVPLLVTAAVALVVTYTRLRRPHPVVVRIVVAAVALMPFALFVYDAAYRAFVR